MEWRRTGGAGDGFTNLFSHLSVHGLLVREINDLSRYVMIGKVAVNGRGIVASLSA